MTDVIITIKNVDSEKVKATQFQMDELGRLLGGSSMEFEVLDGENTLLCYGQPL